MKTEIMTITPDLAQKFLASNNENRPIKKWWVTALSGAMRRGEWKLSHQGIAIGQDGRLLDGQHRLLAVVSCGIPVLMSVTTGVDCDSFISMDVGVKRTVSDSTGLDSGVASVSRAIAMYCYGGTITTAQAYKVAKCGVEEEAMPGRFKIQPLDLPTTGPALLAGSYVIIRPCTVRKEWVAESRNPKPEYIEMAAKALKAAGIYTVCVADIDDTNEWLVGNLPECDRYYIKGELSISQVMNLAEHAVGIVSGVGFALPLAMAYKIPLLCVLGGCLGYNGPDMVMHPDIDGSMVTFTMPGNPCYCKAKDHACYKEMTGYEQQLTAWVSRIGQRALVPSTPTA